jgi:hypothetical protein
MELVVCSGCRRHVDAGEERCPFCDAAVTARPQRASVRGRLSRAAVFSAALVACESKQAPPKPAPPPPQQQQGSDDLEKMLDGDQHVADRVAPTPPPAPNDAALADAGAIDSSTIDAGVTVDAGMDRAKILEHKRRERIRREQHDRERRDERPPPPPLDHMNVPKPYGAPPARRRRV